VELLDTLLGTLRVEPVVLVPDELPGLHPGRSARIEVAGFGVGAVGEIDPGVLQRFEIAERVAWLELDLSVLLSIPVPVATAAPISRYPSSDVDLAFVVEHNVPAASLVATIRGAGEGLVASVQLFDVFHSDDLGEGNRSLAYRVRFQAHDKTLTDKEVAGLREGIIAAVESTHGAKLRA
jgi:phenylalanyl-tRNA synthetase beta chain